LNKFVRNYCDIILYVRNFSPEEGNIMKEERRECQYECQKCGMGVKNLTCGKCDTPLKDGYTTIQGEQIHIVKCPKGCGMIKSPVCCERDMTCEETASHI
jgi:hypothetical protein